MNVTSIGRGFAPIVIGALAVTGLSACSSEGSGQRASAKDDLTITVISGPSSDPFFSAMRLGTEAAAKDLGVTVKWTAPKDLSNMAADYARLGEAALAGKPDGVVVTDFMPEAQDPSITKTIAAGIPVTFLNAAPPNWETTGGLNYMGENTLTVGTAVGERLIDEGKKTVICFNHAPGVEVVQGRCDGLQAVIEKNGGKFKQVDIPIAQAGNATTISNALSGALRDDPSVDAVFTLGSGVAEVASRVIDEADSDAMLVTTDLSTNVLKLISEGEIAFASDQQPWLNGYMSVQAVVMHLRYGMHPIGFVDTAPNWITKENAAQVLEVNTSYNGIRGAQ